MTDVKISALPAASSANAAMQFPANDSGTTKRVTLSQMLASGLDWIVAVPGGATDVTTALQASITAAQTAGVTLYLPAGTYTISWGTRAYGLLISSALNVILDPNAIIKMAASSSFASGKGVGYSTVASMLQIQSSNVTITGKGTFDWNNPGLFGYSACIYVTTGSPAVGGPYYTDVRIDGPKIRNSRGAGIWAEDTSRLWVVNTNHSGGTGTDILVLRSLVSMTDIYVDNNYIDCSTIPTAGVNANATPIQLAINFTGSAGLTTDRWSMSHNTCEAGLNTNVYMTLTQIYSPFNLDGANGVWRRGRVIGNILSGSIGGGGPMGGAEAISCINVVDTTIANNVCRNCYIGIEMAGFGNTCTGNTIDGGGAYMQIGIFMDGGGMNETISANSIYGFGGWSNFQGVSSRGANCAFVGNSITNQTGSGVAGTGLIAAYVDSQNTTLGANRVIVSSNVIYLAGASVAVDIYDTSGTLVANNSIFIETATYSPIYIRAPGTYSHLTRDYISIHDNVIEGGALPLVTQDASADWGTHISYQVDRLGVQPLTNYAADAGATDTYAVTMQPGLEAYTTGLEVKFKANTANTGAATLNVNGLGAKTIVKAVSTTLANNDILASMFCLCVYDGTNFVLMNPRAL